MPLKFLINNHWLEVGGNKSALVYLQNDKKLINHKLLTLKKIKNKILKWCLNFVWTL